jgi:hypothetical protein
MGIKQHKKGIQGNYKMLPLYIGFILATEDGWENDDNHMKVFSH